MGEKPQTYQRLFQWSMAALLLLFCGYNLNDSVHRFEGIVGMTTKNGFGCYCHGEDPTPSVSVWIEGPDTLSAGEEGVYTLFLSRDSTVTAGFNIATQFGSLGVVDSLETYWYEDELTHIGPKPAQRGGTVSWVFSYTAPDSTFLLVDTLFSVGNSANQDTMATEADKWNFGEKFLVTVIGATSVVGGSNGGRPAAYRLHQNYPNPFNPSTTISFDLPEDSSVKITLHDATGRKVQELADAEFPAGTHQMTIGGRGMPLASGVYFYRFQAQSSSSRDSFSSTRKMVLVR
ncbi:MAG: T9SS type A sorting domain-containing protein [Ignavibacteria bacterium]|nr:T9SS type A sorting domain-containing protein [Ignavibacteria bacterium]